MVLYQNYCSRWRKNRYMHVNAPEELAQEIQKEVDISDELLSGS